MTETKLSSDQDFEFSDADYRVLKEQNISVEEARRQLQLLKQPPYFAALDRSCTLGDGINLIDDSQHKSLLELHDKAQAAGRFTKFVPASGAASRMFRDLLFFLDQSPFPTRAELDELAKTGSKEAKSVIKFLANINHFAFHDHLQKQFNEELSILKHQDGYTEVLRMLLTSDGLNYAELPKGVLPFNVYSGDVRTSFEEHIVEAAHTIKDSSGNCHLHFTVSKEHLSRFQELLESSREKYEKAYNIKLDVSFSLQKNSTNMLSLDSNGQPSHDEKGRLMLRPGGHGALIENLGDLQADVVFIKNIDNVQHDNSKEPTLIYKKILSGFLLQTEEELFSTLRKLESSGITDAEIEEILKYAKNSLHINVKSSTWLQLGSLENKREFLFNKLNRPVRVCGMVRNTGEPGGGPFWVSEDDGCTSMQIVEGAQIDPSSADQKAIFNSSTHFNPVDIVCALKDYKGNHFDLRNFINHEAIIKTKKSYKGRDLVACERPGLWNGSMADWITLFVDVPESTFTPVKTVLDFLRK